MNVKAMRDKFGAGRDAFGSLAAREEVIALCDIAERALDERDEAQRIAAALVADNAELEKALAEARDLVRRLVRKPTEPDWDEAESRLRAWEQEAK